MIWKSNLPAITTNECMRSAQQELGTQEPSQRVLGGRERSGKLLSRLPGLEASCSRKSLLAIHFVPHRKQFSIAKLLLKLRSNRCCIFADIVEFGTGGTVTSALCRVETTIITYFGRQLSSRFRAVQGGGCTTRAHFQCAWSFVSAPHIHPDIVLLRDCDENNVTLKEQLYTPVCHR
jgi:hypothetical protein